jgi:hypothetical protein
MRRRARRYGFDGNGMLEDDASASDRALVVDGKREGCMSKEDKKEGRRPPLASGVWAERTSSDGGATWVGWGPFVSSRSCGRSEDVA